MPEETSHFSFTIQLSQAIRPLTLDAIRIVTSGCADWQRAKRHGAESLDFAQAFPDCRRISDGVAELALQIFRGIVTADPENADRTDYLSVSVAPKGFRLQNTGDRAPVEQTVQLLRVLQQRFNLPPLSFTWNHSNELDSLGNEHGGSAVFIEPFCAPVYFNPAQWIKDRTAEWENALDAASFDLSGAKPRKAAAVAVVEPEPGV